MGTLADVKNRAAGLLGRKRLGQAIETSLDTRLDTAYDVVYDQLKQEALVTWSSASGTTIPNGVMSHLAALMALDVTDEIAVSDARLGRIVMKAASAKAGIAEYVTPEYESTTEPEDF